MGDGVNILKNRMISLMHKQKNLNKENQKSIHKLQISNLKKARCVERGKMRMVLDVLECVRRY